MTTHNEAFHKALLEEHMRIERNRSQRDDALPGWITVHLPKGMMAHFNPQAYSGERIQHIVNLWNKPPSQTERLFELRSEKHIAAIQRQPNQSQINEARRAVREAESAVKTNTPYMFSKD